MAALHALSLSALQNFQRRVDQNDVDQLLNNKDNTNLYITLESTTIFQEWNVFFCIREMSTEFKESQVYGSITHVSFMCTNFVPYVHFQLWSLAVIAHRIITPWCVCVCVQQAISRATTLEEVERLNQMLRSGQIPSSKPTQPPESAGKGHWRKTSVLSTVQPILNRKCSFSRTNSYLMKHEVQDIVYPRKMVIWGAGCSFPRPGVRGAAYSFSKPSGYLRCKV